MGGSDTNPNSVQFCTCIHILKIQCNLEAVTNLVKDSHAEVAKDDYQMRSLKNLSRTLFDDTPASLVARLVDDDGLTPSDLEAIQALVERRLKDDRG